uniref:KIB1-4 beta-propeller domain-containing protein n=1 Tax=Leersia perrieri TaxID=77586 RepID=A0A0D9XDC2_9ORYZ
MAADRRDPCSPSSLVLDANLVTGAVYELPPVDCAEFDFVVYDSVGKRMFGIRATCHLQVGCVIESKDGAWYNWDITELDIDGPWFRASPVTNPVLHDGLLYLLGEDGRLAVYDPSKHGEGFHVLDKPRSFGIDCKADSYLFESDQAELMAVLIGNRGTPVHVVKFVEQKMEWEKVESLQGLVLFTGTLTTMMRKTKLRSLQNKVLFPMLHEWPETIHVDVVVRDDEMAFVPRSNHTKAIQKNNTSYGKNMWSYEFGKTEVKKFWGMERVDYSIWVDFMNN